MLYVKRLEGRGGGGLCGAFFAVGRPGGGHLLLRKFFASDYVEADEME